VLSCVSALKSALWAIDCLCVRIESISMQEELGAAQIDQKLKMGRLITKTELLVWTGLKRRFVDYEIAEGRLRQLFSREAARYQLSDIQKWLNGETKRAHVKSTTD
jgi:hypothetical protein